MRRKNSLLSLLLFTVLSCGQSKEAPKAGEPPAPSPTPATPTPAPAKDDGLITAQGIGAFKLGLDFKATEAMKGSYVIMDDMIEFADIGIKVAFNKKTACQILLYKPGPKTKEGLGLGSTYGDFEKALGPGKATGTGFERNFEKFSELRVAPEAEPTPETVIDLLAISECPPKE